MPKRIVKLEAGYNCRDLGGYVSHDGRTVKWGRLYRSGSLSHLTKADQAELARRKIVVDCDLRSRHEQGNFPDKLWPGAKLVDAHFYSESGDEEEEAEAAWEKYSGKLPKLSYLAMVYQQNLVAPRTGLVMRKIFKEMLTLEDDEALIYHCSMGKDRTGMVSVIVLMALGLEDREILRDYLLSREYSQDWDEADENDRLGQQIAKMNQTQVSQTAFYGITETIRQTWGGFDRYFASLGFGQGDLDRLRDKFLE
ncbi:protein tyrosine/serine phosphatase [Lactobacillus delbrueckii]|jgi:protein-tyrosine phosphatase|uniref:tyrosine-protein phosphatase n=1 Tax=Lactobacillus delbrueckii TaxID=1584 RepID=UPI00177FA1BC|nr:tyrosine-protein phosphatase [Lactobacillus delbrueckii]MBD5835335.1 protein-tyrosine-phosphatase [Lactobacillus delbrueckii]GHN24947.1 protein tyrosine/serine phosphatase [Lactobacillus delbrueckii]GHN26785.1 protein tyrosine/serine phosphatase [Lactobacillus delbrueckii]GHN28457.1 protein tyrosine/serine phosphatase [Lactobacillus delbrueckii]GHN32558.1 protein tyrosine/serine phosphatase [Lactobacillus delbrueckii]